VGEAKDSWSAGGLGSKEGGNKTKKQWKGIYKKCEEIEWRKGTGEQISSWYN